MTNEIKKKPNTIYIKGKDDGMKENAFTYRKTLLMIICLVLFIVLMVLQALLIGDIGIKGILSQAQVMISIFLVVKLKKEGFIALVIINSIEILQVAAYALRNHQIQAIPGIVIPITTIMICAILLRTLNHLNEKITESQEKSKRLEENAEELHYLAFHDPLTGLPNRKSLVQDLQQRSETGKDSAMHYALVFIDLDNFGSINDAMGHKTGDLLLQAVSEKMKALRKPTDSLYRWGGDEFALLIEMKNEVTDVNSIIDDFKQGLQCIQLNEKFNVKISASFGVAFYPENSGIPLQLIDYADIAMYKAKDNGRNCICYFDETLKIESARKFDIEQEMIGAIENKELFLEFQPQYDTQTHIIRGFEALLRWHSKSFGLINPDEFIPIAERMGLIINWGNWVLEEACKQFKTIIPKIPDSVHLAVNISASQLKHPCFIEYIQKTLHRMDVPASQLELEITESMFISDVKEAKQRLQELKNMGVHIALDDFGNGYSSLYILQTLPIDTLKIDKALIQGLGSKDNMEQIVESVIHLAKQLNLEVIAEGVETEQQLAFLKENMCTGIQCYLWGGPMEMSEIAKGYMEPSL